MDIYKKLPSDIQTKMFMFFIHPVAKLVHFHYREKEWINLMADIRDYPISLKKLYALPFAKNHNGKWGRATLLNSLWTEARLVCGTYYKIWERMFRINIQRTAEYWIRWRYAVNCHEFQINSLWALFTKEERAKYLQKYDPQNRYY